MSISSLLAGMNPADIIQTAGTAVAAIAAGGSVLAWRAQRRQVEVLERQIAEQASANREAADQNRLQRERMEAVERHLRVAETKLDIEKSMHAPRPVLGVRLRPVQDMFGVSRKAPVVIVQNAGRHAFTIGGVSFKGGRTARRNDFVVQGRGPRLAPRLITVKPQEEVQLDFGVTWRCDPEGHVRLNPMDLTDPLWERASGLRIVIDGKTYSAERHVDERLRSFLAQVPKSPRRAA
ncbi:MAG TPA: hypothetical protein VD971_11665 [Phycisphaerales bacterium]|nr:hypothetical protein [Phycisphaerales bacterium]